MLTHCAFTHGKHSSLLESDGDKLIRVKAPEGDSRTYKIKRTGMLSEILKRTRKRYLDPVLLVWLELFFLSLRGTNSKTTH